MNSVASINRHLYLVIMSGGINWVWITRAVALAAPAIALAVVALA